MKFKKSSKSGKGRFDEYDFINPFALEKKNNKINDQEAKFKETIINIAKKYPNEHYFDLNEKSIFPPEFSCYSVEMLVNMASDLIEKDQLDAKLIGEILII